MDEKLQRIAIAEACRWKWLQTNFDASSGLIGTNEPHSGNIPYQGRTYPSNKHLPTYGKAVPDYLNDLNAMHEAVESLPYKDKIEWVEALGKVLGFANRNEWLEVDMVQATAAQRAEAFLKTLNLWK